MFPDRLNVQSNLHIPIQSTVTYSPSGLQQPSPLVMQSATISYCSRCTFLQLSRSADSIFQVSNMHICPGRLSIVIDETSDTVKSIYRHQIYQAGCRTTSDSGRGSPRPRHNAITALGNACCIVQLQLLFLEHRATLLSAGLSHSMLLLLACGLRRLEGS